MLEAPHPERVPVDSATKTLSSVQNGQPRVFCFVPHRGMHSCRRALGRSESNHHSCLSQARRPAAGASRSRSARPRHGQRPRTFGRQRARGREPSPSCDTQRAWRPLLGANAVQYRSRPRPRGRLRCGTPGTDDQVGHLGETGGRNSRLASRAREGNRYAPVGTSARATL